MQDRNLCSFTVYVLFQKKPNKKQNAYKGKCGKTELWLKKKSFYGWKKDGQLALMESEVEMGGACGVAYAQYRFCSRPNGIAEIFEGNPIT